MNLTALSVLTHNFQSCVEGDVGRDKTFTGEAVGVLYSLVTACRGTLLFCGMFILRFFIHTRFLYIYVGCGVEREGGWGLQAGWPMMHLRR